MNLAHDVYTEKECHPSVATILIGLNDFSEKDVKVMQSMLSIGEPWLRYKWELGTTDECDAVFTLQQAEDGIQSLAFEFVKGANDSKISGAIEYPLRIRILLDFLHSIEDYLLLTGDSFANDEDAVAQGPEQTDLARLLYDQLKQGDCPQAWVLALDGKPWFQVCEQSQEVLIYTQYDLQNILPRGDYQVLAADADVCSQTVMERIPLDHWWWRLSISLSHFGLFEWLPSDGFFRLRGWPDFGALPVHPNHVHLTAHLVCSWYDIETLACVVCENKTHIHSLLNASLLTGNLEFKSAENRSVPAKVRAVPAFFANIRRKFGI